MNRDEAKYLLHAYRVGGQDANDPQFHEALEMLKQDPELARWFAEEQAIDSRLASKLGAFPVPPELKAQLLAARKILRPAPWWRTPARVLAAAASVAILVTATAIWFSMAARENFSDFRSFAATTTAAKMERLDYTSRDLNEVKQWLANRGEAPSDFSIPAGLNGRPSIGCCVMDWRGRKVSLVCFELETRSAAHLFVMDRAHLNEAPSGISKAFLANTGIATVAWTDARHVYVLASKQSEGDLSRLL